MLALAADAPFTSKQSARRHASGPLLASANGNHGLQHPCSGLWDSATSAAVQLGIVGLGRGELSARDIHDPICLGAFVLSTMDDGRKVMATVAPTLRRLDQYGRLCPFAPLPCKASSPPVHGSVARPRSCISTIFGC